MSDGIIAQQQTERSKKLQDALSALRNVYQPDIDRLIYLCYDLGAKQDQIAEVLGTTKQYISMQYPKKKRRIGK